MQRTYPRWPLKNFMCGFSATMPWARGLVSAPSPPEGSAQALEEPALLRLPEERALRISLLGVGGIDAAARCLIVPVLTGVQDVELGEVPVGQAPVEGHVRPLGHRGTAEGHVLVVGLVCSRSPPEELLERERVPWGSVSVVVLDLVVVPQVTSQGKAACVARRLVLALR